MITARPFYFLRHGQTESNVQKIYMGQQDVPLTEHGKVQALKVQPLIEKCRIASVFYSPLGRTSETMAIATANLSCKKIALDELKAWGKHFDEAQEVFHQRIIAGINQALNHPAPVLIVSHGDVYQIVCNILGVTYEAIGNGKLIYFTPDSNGTWKITIVKE